MSSENTVWNLTGTAWLPKVPNLTSYGVTTVEVAKSCPLRVAFDRDARFEGRVTKSAVIGLATHSTIEQISSKEFVQITTLRQRLAVLEKTFHAAIDAKLTELKDSPRNRNLVISPEERAAYRRALLWIAREMSNEPVVEHPSYGSVLGFPNNWTLLREVPIRDTVSGLRGRIDQLRRTDTGLVLSDFKATSRLDVPERYVTQIQIYSALWYVNHCEWPQSAELKYLISGAVHNVDVSEEQCMMALEEARSIPELFHVTNSSSLANPGDTCRVCSSRPWCEPFWQLRKVQDASSGLLSDMSRFGIEGVVQAQEDSKDAGVLRVRWGTRQATVLIPNEIRTEFQQVKPGYTIRILDCYMGGQSHTPVVRLDSQSELFFYETGSNLRGNES